MTMKDIWAKFVLDEFIPTATRRELLNNLESFDYLLLLDLITDIDLAENKEWKKLTTASIKADEELYNWLNKDNTKNYISTIKTIFPFGENNHIEEAMAIFIDDCPLVSNKRKQEYLNLSYNKTNKKSTQLLYNQYLKDNDIVDSTIATYSSSINALRKKGVKIWELNFNEVCNIEEILKSENEITTVLSSALQYYKLFLEESSSKKKLF